MDLSAPISSQRFIILDTETTGPEPGKDVPIEIAMVEWREFQMGEPKSWFVDPGRKIPPSAKAVHHLTEADLVGAPKLEVLWPEVAAFCDDAILMAHNAPFDLAMLPALLGRPYLCTLRMCRHLWQKGEENRDGFPLMSHQQQEIRYWLDLEVDTMGLAAHRAAADILVTGAIFAEAVRLYLSLGGEDSVEAFLDFTNRPIQITRMPLKGKFFGRPMQEVETGYLEWLFRKGEESGKIDPDLRASVKRELDLRKGEQMLVNKGLAEPMATVVAG
jgi:exodeoxyribonuclease X